MERERHPLVPTRRGLGVLIAGAAMAFPAARALSAAVEPDAELIALGRELKDAWQVENETVARLHDNASGAASEQCDAVMDRSGTIVHQIEAISATTIAGLQVKAFALAWTYAGDELTAEELADSKTPTADYRLLAGIVRDLRAIG